MMGNNKFKSWSDVEKEFLKLDKDLGNVPDVQIKIREVFENLQEYRSKSTNAGKEAGVLEMLYRGNINPSDRVFKKNSEYEKILTEICDTDDKLYMETNTNAKKLFDDYKVLTSKLRDIELCELFSSSFKLGAELIFETFIKTDNETNLKPLI